MSLLEEAMEQCVMLDKITVDDGYGGFKSQYINGASFKCATTFDTSMEARLADKQGVSSRYTVTTAKGISLQYHDVFRRIRDGKIFRVTSDGDDKFTPTSATLNMRQVTAEEWVLPNE